MKPSRSIVISGGTRGIGRAVAACFAQAAWQVATAARTEEELIAMQAYWKTHFPQSPLLTCEADLSTIQGCERFAELLKREQRPIDIVVNNVGTFAPGTLLEGPNDQLMHFLRTNLLSAHYFTRTCLPLLRQSSQAHLFTIGSVAATDWPSHMATYALSKEVLHAWHKGVQLELADTSIATTLIVPGATYTSSWNGVDIDPSTLLKPEAVAIAVYDTYARRANGVVEQLVLRPA